MLWWWFIGSWKRGRLEALKRFYFFSYLHSSRILREIRLAVIFPGIGMTASQWREGENRMPCADARIAS